MAAYERTCHEEMSDQKPGEIVAAALSYLQHTRVLLRAPLPCGTVSRESCYKSCHIKRLRFECALVIGRVSKRVQKQNSDQAMIINDINPPVSYRLIVLFGFSAFCHL